MNDPKTELLALLRKKSVFYGDFTLSSGAKSKYYVDCKLTTLDPQGAWLAGQVLRDIIRQQESALGIRVAAVGGLTMGADPIALAAGMISVWKGDAVPLQVFSVRKTPKSHGQTKLIEGNFKQGDVVVVIDDVITKGESTLAAIKAVEQEGGKVGFVAALVDRQEGGRDKIESLGHRVFAAFRKGDVISESGKSE